MIIVIFAVCVAVILLGAWVYNCVNEFAGGWILFCGIAGSVISFIALIVLLITVSGLNVIDNKIEMYQSENANIEQQISDCVEQYQKYETDIFTEVKPDSAVTLVALYPELKSDELVKKQLEIYIANNQKIKELKEEKIMGNVYRWWTYFGRSDTE